MGIKLDFAQLRSDTHQDEFSLQDKPGYNRSKAANTQQEGAGKNTSINLKVLLNEGATHASKETIR